MSESQQAEDNPYLATQVADIATSVGDNKKPGPVAVVFSVIVGLMIAIVMFCVTFFFTCLGISTSTNRNNESAVALMFSVAGLTAVAAFAFSVWGFLKIVKALKN